jgi:phosphatidylethanolamine N-methyltransferase
VDSIIHAICFFRTSDLKLVLLIAYALFLMIFPTNLSHRTTLMIHFCHSLAWTLFHSFGLGLILQLQSKNKTLVRHYLKHYPYPSMSRWNGIPVAKAAAKEAFENWKALYNLSSCMTYGLYFSAFVLRCNMCWALSTVSFIGLVWKTYAIPVNWTVGTELLRHTLGAVCAVFCKFFSLKFWNMHCRPWSDCMHGLQ